MRHFMNITAFGRSRAVATGLAAALALGGCAAGMQGVPPAEAGIPVPQDWNGLADTGPIAPEMQGDYWRALGDPVLAELVETAIANNLDLAQSAARLARAREGLTQARAGYLPQASADGSVSRDIFDLASGDETYALGASVSWEADLSGRIGSSVQAARQDYISAGYSLADMQRLIAGQVALQTVQARATANQLAIARNTLDIQDENLQIARWRLQAGLVSSLDVEQARSQRAQTAASIPQLESSLAATGNALSTLIGETPGRVRELLQAPVEVPEPPALATLDAPADMLRRRPDVRGAEANLLADTARIGVARAALLPQLRLSGNVGTAATGSVGLFDYITGSLLGSISQLLFDGGRTQAQIRAAEAVRDGTLAGYRKAILTALEEVESAIAARQAADLRLVALAEALEAANNSALLARSQYQAGLTDFQTLLTSENQLLGARNSVISAEADRASAFIRLTQAMGGGWAANDAIDSSSDRTTP